MINLKLELKCIVVRWWGSCPTHQQMATLLVSFLVWMQN